MIKRRRKGGEEEIEVGEEVERRRRNTVEDQRNYVCRLSFIGSALTANSKLR